MASGRPRVQRGVNVSQEEKVPLNDNGPENEEVPNEVPMLDVNAALAQMANAITMQAGRNVTTPASRIRDFTRMNPQVLYGSKVEEEPQEFIDQVLKVVTIMGVTSIERAELAAYQLQGVAQEWYAQCLEARVVVGPVTWDEFKVAFLDHFFPLVLREVNMREFMNLKQGNMSVREYSLKFTRLSKYAKMIVANPRAKMSQYMSELNDTLANACHSAMLNNDIDIARLMTHMEEIEGQNMKIVKAREFKKARFEEGFSKGGGGIAKT